MVQRALAVGAHSLDDVRLIDRPVVAGGPQSDLLEAQVASCPDHLGSWVFSFVAHV
jgi:hypothetical protein